MRLHAVTDKESPIARDDDPMDDPETRADFHLNEALRHVTACILAREEAGLNDDAEFLELAAAHSRLSRVAG